MDCKKYIRTFTEQEKNLLNTIENDLIKYSTMSVYSYFKKLINEVETDFIEVSYRKFIKRYNRYHKPISKDTLNNRINLLVDLGALERINAGKGKKHAYKLKDINNNTNCLDSSLDSFLDSSKPLQPIENTSIEEEIEKPKYINNNNNINNIYITTKESFVILEKVFKIVNVKDRVIKNYCIEKLKQVADKINPFGALEYITKLVLKAKEFIRTVSKLTVLQAKGYYNKFKKKDKKGSFCNYQQREYTKEEFAKMEEDLIGWF